MQKKDPMEQNDLTEKINGYYTCLVGFGGFQLFCGIAALALGIANAIVCGMLGSIGYGIWGSVIYFAAGATGIMAFVQQTRCSVGTHMILSIVAACSAAVQLGMGAGSAVADHTAKKSYDSLEKALANYSNGLDYFMQFGCIQLQRDTYWTFQGAGPTVTDSLLASFAVMSGFVALMGAIYSCRICICPPGVSLYVGNTQHVVQTNEMTIISKA